MTQVDTTPTAARVVAVQLENVVWDAVDPHRLGGFWAAALGATPLTDEPDLYEARIDLGSGRFLDLCFPRVAAADLSSAPARLHLDLAGGDPATQSAVVERLTTLGATPADIGQHLEQHGVPWVVLADPQDQAFCVMEDRPSYRRATGPVAALPLDSADPERDAAFWAAVSGWERVPAAPGGPPSTRIPTLQHPSGAGPLLELCPEPEPKPAGAKNRLHLDVRREASDGGDDAVLARLHDLGATLVSGPGVHPWLVFTDPSGNELCVLAAPGEGSPE